MSLRILTNRDRAKASRRVGVWCGGCDRNLISDVGKCPVCGSRLNEKRQIDKDIQKEHQYV
jgi:rRNA maturation endonuclease Nob1